MGSVCGSELGATTSKKEVRQANTPSMMPVFKPEWRHRLLSQRSERSVSAEPPPAADFHNPLVDDALPLPLGVLVTQRPDVALVMADNIVQEDNGNHHEEVRGGEESSTVCASSEGWAEDANFRTLLNSGDAFSSSTPCEDHLLLADDASALHDDARDRAQKAARHDEADHQSRKQNTIHMLPFSKQPSSPGVHQDHTSCVNGLHLSDHARPCCPPPVKLIGCDRQGSGSALSRGKQCSCHKLPAAFADVTPMASSSELGTAEVSYHRWLASFQ